MPLFIPVVVVTSALIAFAGAVYGCDQENKREEEQERARGEIDKLKKRISKFERKRDRLLPQLGKKNHQVRALVDEISRLRAELEEAHRRAG